MALRFFFCVSALLLGSACSLPTEGTGANANGADGGGTGGTGGGITSDAAVGGNSGDGASGGTGGITTLDCPAPSSCVPAPPAGWVGYARMRGEAFPPASSLGPACPDGSTPERYQSGPAGPAECAACTCDSQKGGSCGTAPLLCSDTSSDCSNASDMTGIAAGGCDNGDGSKTKLSCFIGAIPVQAAGTCAPSTSDFANKDSWQNANDVCRMPGKDGCGSGQACVTGGDGDYAGFICIEAPGDLQCPPDWGVRTVVYKSATDDRACTACQCTPDTPVCVDAEYTFYDGLYCTLGDKKVGSSQCTDVSSLLDFGVWSAKQTRNPYATGTCTASGGQATGSVTPQGAITFCCRN